MECQFVDLQRLLEEWFGQIQYSNFEDHCIEGVEFELLQVLVNSNQFTVD